MLRGCWSVFGCWAISPDPSVTMPVNGQSLLMLIPVHVDDGLSICNSLALYNWFLRGINKHFVVNNLRDVALYVNIWITCDCPNRLKWLLQQSYIESLLSDYKLLADRSKVQAVPLCTRIHKIPTAPVTSVPSISDADLPHAYRKLVGKLLYIGICTRPDILYLVMALAQFNVLPTRAHLLVA
jgi:hypothetical protein